jgi:hypothetical protein
VGQGSLATNITGDGNTAVGKSTLNANTGSNNTAVGKDTLGSNTTGANNTAVGYNAGTSVTTGYQNVILGNEAGNTVTTGYNNVLIGHNSGTDITSGHFNTCIAPSTAGNNLTTGDFNVYLGYLSQASGNNATAEIVIGAGNAAHTGKGNSTAFISVSGGGVYQGNNTTTWATTSDQRLKKNIVDSTIGLAEINQLQIRNFEYRTVDEITELADTDVINIEGVQVGVIAQEIQAILPNCVNEESTGVLSVNPDNLTWHLVKAIQEQSALITSLTDRITALEG